MLLHHPGIDEVGRGGGGGTFFVVVAGKRVGGGYFLKIFMTIYHIQKQEHPKGHTFLFSAFA